MAKKDNGFKEKFKIKNMEEAYYEAGGKKISKNPEPKRDKKWYDVDNKKEK